MIALAAAPRSIASWSAEAKTSAGAPLAICVTSTSDAAKLKLTFTPGCGASKALPMSRKALVRLAAAETRSLLRGGARWREQRRERRAGRRGGMAHVVYARIWREAVIYDEE